ncbi:unnamed protein product [Caenorhabditis bovis]|uniref:G-protein coupled receptors family 1 profile domain-containing protein n=1 Tax=Caenorhabditis bovis TaxID=2654633 RepID=A0A8S1EX59_9PELO|nr:unnamed protein product [Caenorhabditis bovis]
MPLEFFFYLFLGIFLFTLSLFLLITILVNSRLRDKYSIFSVKFLVDVILGLFLIILACLDRNSSERVCGATLVLSSSIPLLQVLLLLCEVIDWSLAAFSPVYFHQSSLFSRVLPFIAGAVCYFVILTALVVIDATVPMHSCTRSPEASAVITCYDFSLAITTVCVIILSVLLHKNLNSSYFKPVMLHFLATIFLEEIPLLACIILKYYNPKKAIFAADLTNWLVCVHSIFHTAYFIGNHQDFREIMYSKMQRFSRKLAGK